SNERISQQFLDELRAMEGQMWNSVSDVNCRRSMIYFGEYRLLSPSLLGNLPTVANTKMYIELAKQPPSPEEAAFVLNTYSENDSNVRQAVSDWLQCIGELSCNSEGRFQISVRAWYAASAFGIQPATIDAGYYPAAFDSAAVLQGQEALTAFWIDRFFSQYAEELRKGKKLRIAFLHRIQAVVQSNALWASRAQILLKVPWDRQQGVQERDYRRLLQTAVLVDPNSPDRTHIEDWTMKMEYVGNATPVAYQMDYAVAGGATDQFLQIVSALIDAADREIDDDALATSLEPRQLMANALLAGTPAEVLEVTRRTAKTNTVVRAGQPLFTYVSDDIFKVSFRVPKSHPLASFPLGSPVSIALVPSDKNTIAVQVCDTDLQYCRDPSQLESAVQLSRLVFATSLSAAVVEGGNFVVLEFIIKCGERCRSMASPRTASPADDHSAASPLSLLRVYSEAQDPNGLFFSNNLLKSRGPWTVVPSWQQ
ncbi:hypothetical protein, partial [Mesorhizobium sp.]|uniref:hypothetical protein n=1 Tax=Mesorhizobium sp. TaxID=1871066 RepID=UPI0025EBD5A9